MLLLDMAEAPAGDETLTPDDADKVLEEILEAQSHSYVLGLKLKLPLDVVDAIHSTNPLPHDRLRQVLVEFTKQIEPKPTWRAIVAALRHPAVNLCQLAMTVEAVHFPDPTTIHDAPTDSPTETVTISEATFDYMPPVSSSDTSSTQTSAAGAPSLMSSTSESGTDMVQRTPPTFTPAPTLPELLSLRTSSGTTINVVQQIGVNYSTLGPLLLDDDMGAVTPAIVTKHQRDAEAINKEIVTRWLQGRGKQPVSWSTLTDVLKEAGLPELSRRIQESLTTDTLVTRSEATPVTSPKTSSTQNSASEASCLELATSQGGPDVAHPTLHSDMSVDDVKAEIENFEERFEMMKLLTIKCLEKFQISVVSVVYILTSLSAVYTAEYKEFLNEKTQNPNQCQNHWMLFGQLNFHWNYLSYHLLDHLIKEVSLKYQFFTKVEGKAVKESLKDVKQQMSSYKSDLKRFREQTPLKLFCQAEKWRIDDPPPGFEKMVVKYDWPITITLEHVELFRQHYVCHYNLRDCAMMLNSVKPGTFTVTWFVPSSVIELLKKKAPEVFQKFNISRLEFPGMAGYCVYEAPVQCNAAEDGAVDDSAGDQDIQGESLRTAENRAVDDRVADDRAADSHFIPFIEASWIVDPNSAQPANKALDADERAALHCADGQHLQREPGRLNIWRYIAGGLFLMIIIAGVGAFFYFDSERSAKEEVVRVCDSQQKELQNKVEGCKANLYEINCLKNEVDNYKTRLSEKEGEYNHLQDEYIKKWQEREQLEQKNKAQTETIEAKTKEIDDLKAKLIEMRNKRDQAIDEYGKGKQENEKCNSKLSSESKIVQDQKRTLHDLRVKLRTAEKQFYDYLKKDLGNWGTLIMITVNMFALSFVCIASFRHTCNSK